MTPRFRGGARGASLLLAALSFAASANGQVNGAVYGRSDMLPKPILGLGTERASYAPDRVLVAFKPAAGRPLSSAMVAAPVPGLQLDPQLSNAYFATYDLLPGVRVDDAIRMLRRNPNVRLAEPDATIKMLGVTNDPYFPVQWGLQNTGQDFGTPGFDIGIVNAWKLTKGAGNVKVAVIDTGVDMTHEDLQNSILRSGGQVVGYDFVNMDADPTDDNGHGTAGAGVIAGQYYNGIGIAGIAFRVSLMPIKIADADGNATMSRAIMAVDWAREHGAKIIDASWGFPNYSGLMLEAFQRAGNAGIVVAAAAGNDGRNIDDIPVFPAGYNRFLSNVVAVGAANRVGEAAPFSNYGNSLDVFAPGQDVPTTIPGSYSYVSGTSVAASHVAGVAGLIKSLYPNATPAEIKSRILGGAKEFASLAAKGYRMLNAANALDNDSVAPSPITNLHPTLVSTSAVSYEFTSPGDDGNTGNVASFDVRYSPAPITESNFDYATPCYVGESNVPAGTNAQIVVRNLLPVGDRKIYVAIRAVDNVGNKSSIAFAPVVTLRTPLLFDDAETTPRFTGSGFVTTNEDHAGGNRSWTDSPGNLYPSNSDVSLTQSDALVAPGSMMLMFDAKYEVEGGYDWFYVDVSYDGGVGWTTLQSFTGSSNGWKGLTYFLDAKPGDAVKVRFRMTSDSIINLDGVHLDDIRLVPAQKLNYDDVESGSKFKVAGTFGITDATSASPSHSWDDSPGGNYPSFANTTITTLKRYLANRLLPAYFAFSAKSDQEFLYDRTSVIIGDYGKPDREFDIVTGQFDWTKRLVDVTETSRKFIVRFRMTSDGSYEGAGVNLDDFFACGEQGYTP